MTRISNTVALTDLAGTAAVVSSLVFVWPQVARIMQSRDSQGISVIGTLWPMAGFTLWSAYGLQQGRAPIWIANGQALAGFAIVLVYRLRHGEPVDANRVLAVLGAGVVVAFGAIAPAPVVGITAILVGATSFLPQAVVAWRALDVSGVSATTYWLLALSASLWIFYGVTARDFLVIAPNLLIVPTATVIAIRASVAVGPDADDIGVEAV